MPKKEHPLVKQFDKAGQMVKFKQRKSDDWGDLPFGAPEGL